MLDKMLQFNPGFRSTASELLQHPVFDGIRDKTAEKPCPEICELPVFAPMTFDYENMEPISLSVLDLRKQIVNEAASF